MWKVSNVWWSRLFDVAFVRGHVLVMKRGVMRPWVAKGDKFEGGNNGVIFIELVLSTITGSLSREKYLREDQGVMVRQGSHLIFVQAGGGHLGSEGGRYVR